MNTILYNLIILVSRLPLNYIYKITDGLTFFIFKVFKYRTNLIKENIQNSFPEKSTEEIKEIIEKFYTRFSSFIAEIIKLFTVSEEEQLKMLNLKNLNVINNESNKNSIVLMGHVMNWELIPISVKIYEDKFFYITYMKIQNKFWEEKFLELRNKYKVSLVLMEKTMAMMKNTPNNGSSVFCLIGDQSPHISKAKLGLNFLGRETPIFVGYDFLAVEKDFNVYYAEVICTERGKYDIIVHKIEPDNGVKFQELEISTKYFKLLETTIRNNPDNYLWTHNRWKHVKGVHY